MRGYGYDPGPDLGWFPSTRYAAHDSAKAHENSPQIVLGQIGLILAVALGLALIVNLILFNFDIGWS
jgi:hypothetical protein